MAILLKSGTDSTEKNRWGTQPRTMDDARRVTGFRFILDLCAEPQTAKCAKFIEPWEDSLKVDWKDRFSETQQWHNTLTCVNRSVFPEASWCNPPFDMKEHFLQRCFKYSKEGMNIIALIPYERGTNWWRHCVTGKAQTVYLPDGRYNFLKPDGVTKKSGVNFLSCLVHYSPRQLNAQTEYVDYKRIL